MKVKSKPLPPLRKLEGMEEKEDEEEEEEIEMKGLVGSAEDDYYSEDPSNIGTSFSRTDILNLIPCVCYLYSCSDRS